MSSSLILYYILPAMPVHGHVYRFYRPHHWALVNIYYGSADVTIMAIIQAMIHCPGLRTPIQLCSVHRRCYVRVLHGKSQCIGILTSKFNGCPNGPHMDPDSESDLLESLDLTAQGLQSAAGCGSVHSCLLVHGGRGRTGPAAPGAASLGQPGSQPHCKKLRAKCWAPDWLLLSS